MANLRDKKHFRIQPPKVEDLLDFGPEETLPPEAFADRVQELLKKIAELRSRIDRLSEAGE